VSKLSKRERILKSSLFQHGENWSPSEMANQIGDRRACDVIRPIQKLVQEGLVVQLENGKYRNAKYRHWIHTRRLAVAVNDDAADELQATG